MIGSGAIETLEGGRFQDPHILGKGGMGVVWSVLDAKLGRRVALKTLKKDNPEALLRLKNEFRALTDVKHPNLVQLHELILEAGMAAITMELVEGESLPSFLTTTLGPRALAPTPIDSTFADFSIFGTPSEPAHPSVAEIGPDATPCRPEDLRSVLPQLVAGIDALHAAGKLHRDIKPSNVMVTPEGRVVLLDFGLVTATDQQVVERVGTPSYMAPEQMRGEATEASDWYGVGALLYRGLTGRPPHVLREGNMQELAQRKSSQRPTHPALLVEDVDEDLADLAMALLNPDPARRPDAAEIARRMGFAYRAARRMRQAHFVGREAELGVMLHALQQTSQGSSVTVVVRGPSGIGKSALIEHFLSEHAAKRPRLLKLTGRCYEREQVPFKGVDSVIDALTDALIAQPASDMKQVLSLDLGSLALLFPVLERVPGVIAPERGRDVHDQRWRALATLRLLFRMLAQRGTLVVYIDDIQWIDPDGVAVLEELVRPPGMPAVLWLFGLRTDVQTTAEIEPLLAGDGNRKLWDLELAPLTEEEARRLALTVIPDGDADRLAGVLDAAQGSPFYIRELSQHAPAGLSQHESLDEVLGARIDELDVPARELLEVIAVAGYPIPQQLALDAAQLDDELLIVGLASEHLVRVRGTADVAVVEPLHDRIREVAAARCGDRLGVHRRLATALEPTDADPEIVATHWLGAGNEVRAANLALSAAENAGRNLAFARAVRLFEMADRLLAPDHPARVTLPRQMADAWAHYGRPLKAAPLYLTCADGESGHKRLEYLQKAADQYFAAGQFLDALRVLDAVLKTIGRRITGGRAITLVRMLWGRLRLELRGWDYQAVPRDRISKEKLLEIDTYWAVSRGLAMVDPLRSQEYQQYATLLALEVGDPYRVVCNLAMELGFLGTLGGPSADKARATARQCLEAAEKVGEPHAKGLAIFGDGFARCLRGEFLGAAERCETAERIFREECTNVAWETSNSQRFRLASHLYLGDLAIVREGLQAALSEAGERGDILQAADLRMRLNLSLLCQDRHEEAREAIADALEHWSGVGFNLQHLSAMVAFQQVSLYKGEPEVARARVDAMWSPLWWSGLLRVQMLHIEARNARAGADVAVGDRRSLRRAAGDAKRILAEDMAWSNPLGWTIEAAIACQGGNLDDCQRLLERALDGFGAAEMGLHRDVIALRLAEHQRDSAAIEVARGALRKRGVSRPGRIAVALAPGFRSPRALEG